MRKQSINLAVPTPCHENWDHMTSNEQGRHCASCNKTVIDFSLYTDKELVEFFKKTEGNVCGRLSTYQISNPIIVTEQSNNSFFHKLFLGSALASWLGFGTNAHAQQADNGMTIKQTSTAQHTHALKRPRADTSCRVSGKVVDGNQNPIQDATVSFYSASDDSIVTTVYTDSTGSFNASLPEKYYKHKMSFNAYSYRHKNLHEDFTVQKTQYFKIELTHYEHMIMGKIKCNPH